MKVWTAEDVKYVETSGWSGKVGLLMERFDSFEDFEAFMTGVQSWVAKAQSQAELAQMPYFVVEYPSGWKRTVAEGDEPLPDGTKFLYGTADGWLFL